MYDCDKGYVLDTGPPGATCVGGLWRPTELPRYIKAQIKSNILEVYEFSLLVVYPVNIQGFGGQDVEDPRR